MPTSQIYESPTIVLTDAEIKALPTTPIEIVPAVAGKILKFLSAMVIIDVQAGVYTNVHADLNIQFTYDTALFDESASSIIVDPVNSLTDANNAWVSDVGPFFYTFNSAVGMTWTLVNVQGQAFQLKADNAAQGDFTGGHADNTIKVRLFYLIIDV